MLNLSEVRQSFPFLDNMINGEPMIYLDSAATTQKPAVVIDSICDFYRAGVANVHRSVNHLAQRVTEQFEDSRDTIARFINAETDEIFFVGNATLGINLLSQSIKLSPNARIITSTLEHHSNLLPWMQFGELRYCQWNEQGEMDLQHLKSLLEEGADLVTIASASNLYGSTHPVKEITALAHQYGAKILVDASQSVAHEEMDVQDIDCDFMVFSAHKMYGPGGIGVVYAKKESLNEMSPVLLGGSMVKEVHSNKMVLNDIPYRFEAGTPNIEGVIGFAAAADFIESVGYDDIHAHETGLIRHAKTLLKDVPGLIMHGPAIQNSKAPIVSFEVEGLSSNAVAKMLGNRSNIYVRSGYHCAQPAHDELGIGVTVRASLGMYNNREEIEKLAQDLHNISASV